jgi:hypothetical protein
MNLNNLKVGDRLVREKGGILTKHHGIYAGTHNNIQFVAENQTGYGVRCITLEQFLSEGQIVRIENYDYSHHQQNNIIHRINQRIGREYDLLSYNCEHFANEVLTGIKESKQVQFAIGGAIVVGLLALIYIANKE